MKKVLIAAGVALMGFAAKAAVASWMVGFITTAPEAGGWSSSYLGDTDTGYTAILSLYSDAGLTTLVGTSSANVWADGIASGETDSILNNATETTYYGQVIVSYKDQTLTSQAFQFTTSTLDDYSYLTIATDPSTVDGVFKIGGESFASDANGAFTAAGWTAAAVPEPTSGLLLLLGMAGLALRRKQK